MALTCKREYNIFQEKGKIRLARRLNEVIPLKFSSGDKVYLIENGNRVSEVTVTSCRGGWYIVRFDKGSVTKVRESRLFTSQEEATVHLQQMHPGLVVQQQNPQHDYRNAQVL